jgi:biotin transport system ATP-binding protein
MISSSPPLIEILHLSYRYPDNTPGIDDISLTIAAGECVVIAGPNGSGKTTLFRHLNGLLLPQSGNVRIDGISVVDDVLRARRTVGLVFQDADSQIVGETVYDDVAFGPENLCFDSAEIQRRVTSALSLVGMQHLRERRPHRLSGGEKRRLAIAGILAMESPVIVLDEPFANLDHAGALQVLSQIVSLHRFGKTVILATHDLDRMMGYADRLILMQAGSILQDGPFASVIQHAASAGIEMPCTCRMESVYG